MRKLSNSKMIAKLTKGPRHHFFGYYGVIPWDRAGQWIDASAMPCSPATA
jgi:hypothetical protein